MVSESPHTNGYEDIEDASCSRWRQRKFLSVETKDDLKAICKLSFTIIAINVTSHLVNPIALMFVGQLGVVQLDGVSLASTLYNVTTEAVTAGMTSASDTLFAQCYGSYNKKKVGVYLQQGLMIIMLFLLPTLAIHLNSEGLLLLLGQDADVARVTGQYLLMTLPGMFFFFLWRILASYLRAINKLLGLMMSGVAGMTVNIVGHYLLVVYYPYGITGSALAQNLCYFTMFTVEFLYILFGKVYTETWDGWTTDAFQNWGYFLYIGTGGFVLWTVEWMGQEIGAIFAGNLGKNDLAAQAVLYQLYVVLYSFPFGFLVGGNVRIAMLLGSGDVERTKRNAKLSVIINAVSTISLCLLIIILRWELPKLLTSDVNVIEMAANLMPLMALLLLMDGTNGGLSGILRGCGRHMTGVIISLTEYIIVIIPLSAVLMFLTGIGVAGFWTATSIGLFLGNLFFIVYLFFRLDWKKEGEKALRNAGISSDPRQDVVDPHPQKVNSARLPSSYHLEEIDMGSERVGLLSYKDLARQRTEDKLQHFQQLLGLRYHGSKVSFVDLVSKKKPTDTKLPTSTLIWRRSLFILFMFSTLIVSVLTRLFLEPPHDVISYTNMTSLCLPDNATIPPDANFTLPWCSDTVYNINS